MSELINSLKTLAYGGGGGSQSIADRRSSTGQLRIIPLLNLGRNDSSNDSSFTQWRDAMRMVARLPGGLPPEFRLRLWENLSDRYMQDHGISWSRVMAKCRLTNSRDVEIADQIEKDLHRTGCTGFEGGKQAMLKRVLVSYSRWNPSVGYCQGFNMIGAMLLQMTSGDETLTLKVLIFLIEGVLPQGYFSQGLRGLAVDMAVFREILRLRKPTLHNHLSILQNGDENPPLTDVFTMHWFLTLFIHCLPTNAVLRVWDLVFLEGSEVLLRTALVLWTAIEPRILAVNSADEFYSVMGVVTRELLEFGLMDPNALVKCIVSVGPFPFPGLAELRQQQRALIQQDTPYKSFFLAKRELDNLKRHYAAMKDRQKATTIILKGLETSRIRVPGQRSNSLFVAPTTVKKQMANSSKPKMRRASSGCKGTGSANNNNNLNSGNLNNRATNSVRHGASNANATGATGATGVVGVKTAKQITMTWDKAAPKIRSKTFRRRRTASASSGHTTDSSSSTELCDSNSLSDSSESDGVWSETDGRWKKPKSSKKKTDSPGSLSLKSAKSNLSLCPPPQEGEEDLGEIDKPPRQQGASLVPSEIGHLAAAALPPLEMPSREKSSGGSDEQPFSPERSPSLGETMNKTDDDHGHHGGTKILDTNDSQHFLEEISRLGKSDSFYENLSKRICELQFQNLRILNSCNTTIDPKSLLMPEFEKSPLPSPMNPCSPKPFENGIGATLIDTLYLAGSSPKLTPSHSPKCQLSPRDSVSSVSECPNSPLKTPNSPNTLSSLSMLDGTPSTQQVQKSRRSSYTRRTSSAKSSQSVSSMDIPDICVDGPDYISGENLKNNNSNYNNNNKEYESSEEIADSVSNFIMTLQKKNNDATEVDGDSTGLGSTSADSEKENKFSGALAPGSPRKASNLTLDLSACNSLGAGSSMRPFTPLKTPDFLQLNSIVPNEMTNQQEDKKKKLDTRSCLVSPVLSPDLTETNLSGKKGKRSPPKSPPKDITIPPRPKNFPVSPNEDFLLATYTNSMENGFDGAILMEQHAHHRQSEEELSGSARCCGARASNPDILGSDELELGPVFPTTACPCQCQTTEEINAVIRQNIAILQRLKLKPTYDVAILEGGADDEYEDVEFDEDEASSCSDFSTEFPELVNFNNYGKEEDSSDRDSGLPTCSSKNSLSRKGSYSTSHGKNNKGSLQEGTSLRHQDSSGCSSGGSSGTIATISAPCPQNNTHGSNSSSTAGAVVSMSSPARRRNSSSGTSTVMGGANVTVKPVVRRKSLTRTSSGNSSMASGGGAISSGSSSAGGPTNKQAKQKKNFNPFPTTRKIRVRTTKFGLYN